MRAGQAIWVNWRYLPTGFNDVIAAGDADVGCAVFAIVHKDDAKPCCFDHARNVCVVDP